MGVGHTSATRGNIDDCLRSGQRLIVDTGSGDGQDVGRDSQGICPLPPTSSRRASLPTSAVFHGPWPQPPVEDSRLLRFFDGLLQPPLEPLWT